MKNTFGCPKCGSSHIDRSYEAIVTDVYANGKWKREHDTEQSDDSVYVFNCRKCQYFSNKVSEWVKSIEPKVAKKRTTTYATPTLAKEKL